MKLYLLRPQKVNDTKIDLWNPWYDTCGGFVVVARHEAEARTLAALVSGDEGTAAWMDSLYSSCTELKAEDFKNAGVVMKDFHAA